LGKRQACSVWSIPKDCPQIQSRCFNRLLHVVSPSVQQKGAASSSQNHAHRIQDAPAHESVAAGLDRGSDDGKPDEDAVAPSQSWGADVSGIKGHVLVAIIDTHHDAACETAANQAHKRQCSTAT
jgi:hypothetical protein